MVRDRLRSRFADETAAAIKDVALSQLAVGGPGALSINAIARELGVSGPALYRYYPSRDDLLDDIVVDAYLDLARRLRQQIEPVPVGDQLIAFAQGYRTWALAQPHRYRLLYAPVLPDYDPHAAPPVGAAQQVMDLLLDVLVRHRESRRLRRPRAEPRQRWPESVAPDRLRGWAENRGAGTAAPYALQAVMIWTRLHGLAGLEIDGNYAALGFDPSSLYAQEAEAVLELYPLLPE